MASHKSAKKRAKQSLKKNSRNRSYMSMVKSIAKKFLGTLTEVEQGKATKEDLSKSFQSVQSALHKAAAKGHLPKNNVARRVSRLANLMAKKA